MLVKQREIKSSGLFADSESEDDHEDSTAKKILTEIPPPSRFFQEDLNNFVSPSHPTPSHLLSSPSQTPNRNCLSDHLYSS
uniref:Uncharacterized protein n=1 Tax=Brassica oleracea var. oleracea TaxID=109376 RepID=A0A0D3E7V9_BRAOL